jgi:hypothetical protein
MANTVKLLQLFCVSFIAAISAYRQASCTGWRRLSSGFRLQKLQATIHSCLVPTPQLDRTVQLYRSILPHLPGMIQEESQVHLSDETFLQFEAPPQMKNTEPKDETMVGHFS